MENESEVAQSCPTLCDSMDYQAPHPWNFPGKESTVGGHFLLQGIFPTQGSNPGLPHCRQTLYRLNHQASLKDWHKKWEPSNVGEPAVKKGDSGTNESS